ncbi:PREDICTED: deoxyribonuclease-1-like 2 [Cyprinodon variegatus]|uniref:Deoxyribonuclease n=1 Tax=Cyprinodon variegatus TaxID=28743 RepID=A0A3Q2CNB1_CYPVA|nr:PREDICTED: deoxyribonuclease-1-like 2 [Cyprinodon variegatus]
MRLLYSVVFFVGLLHLSSSFLLGAFNIQSFGTKKASDKNLMETIAQIVRRYDIVLIQEVRDIDLSATNKLMEYVNRICPTYSYIVSEPLGRNTYKERYLFLYREESVSVVENYTYNDINNKFMREPFIVMFSSINTAVSSFVLIPQHTSPSSAVEEIDALYDVVDDVCKRWETKDIVLLGDFNAGCSYVTRRDWAKIRLYRDKSFQWLIPDTVDTTVSNSGCPYDRIVAKEDIMRGVVMGSAKVYDFEAHLHLSKEQAKKISDHFPVEVELKPKLA